MDIAVPSRFACLKIEDDDIRPQNNKPKEVKKKTEKKVIAKKSDIKDVKPPTDKSNNGAKKSSSNKQNTNVPATTANKKDKKKHNTQQWEQWKEKDDEIINGNYEADLQSAILLSTLDYEHNKELYRQYQEEHQKEKAQAQNKKKKNKAMSLEQFLNSGNNNKNKANSHNTEANAKVENELKDENFFEKIQMEAKEEFNKEQIKEKRKKREANIDEIISLAQCQQKLEDANARCAVLQVQVSKLKLENTAVKERNKTLCNILGQGEMKDKADVLLELEKLYSEKRELSEEVSKLHVLLEQERSKVAALTSDLHNNKHKDKKRKQKG
ncbi:hypothetical protein ILUMI_20648 [Ignelater luminosus]|uniref:G kinase-anchoring protein 1 n=1 Tax=Ignelater luminosus TaxID=2038154 RepID=A0A8K0CJ88_IGNLU|nr:hypothetical protein ILUMI_20648 [Ignelater luminosus]